MDTLDQKHFMRCNACHATATSDNWCENRFRRHLIVDPPKAGARVDHWPCSEQEHGHWVVVVLLAHDWTGDAWSGATCKRCGAWASTMKPIPRYGCVPPGETLPMVVEQSMNAEIRALYKEHGLDPDNPWHVGRVADAARRLKDGTHCGACGYPLDECVCRDEP